MRAEGVRREAASFTLLDYRRHRGRQRGERPGARRGKYRKRRNYKKKGGGSRGERERADKGSAVRNWKYNGIV